MPTYDYKCNNCDHTFEIFQSMKDEKLTKCPVCQKDTLQRLIGAGSGLIFKGTGFYLTDYKNKSSETSSSSGSTSIKESNSVKSDSVNAESKTSAESNQKSKSDSDSTQTGAQKSEKKNVEKSTVKSGSENKTSGKKE